MLTDKEFLAKVDEEFNKLVTNLSPFNTSTSNNNFLFESIKDWIKKDLYEMYCIHFYEKYHVDK
jgi:hypothetical protein